VGPEEDEADLDSGCLGDVDADNEPGDAREVADLIELNEPTGEWPRSCPRPTVALDGLLIALNAEGSNPGSGDGVDAWEYTEFGLEPDAGPKPGSGVVLCESGV
jgi:hypothetical protein